MKGVMELRQERAGKIARMAEINEGAEKEERDLTEEEVKEYEGLKELVATLAERIARMEEVGGLQEEAQRSAAPVAGRKAPAFNKTRVGDTEERALAHYFRTGDNGALAQLRAANNTIGNEGTGADGLYAVPTGHYRDIIAKRDESMLAAQMPIMRIPGTGLTVNVPVDNETDVEFASTSEQDDNYAQTYTRDFPAINQVAMTLVKYTKKIALTEELLEDEDSNLLAFIAGYVGRAMAGQHNTLLLTELRASGTAALTLDSASTIGAAEIPELVYKLPAQYEDGAVWAMARGTEGLLRGLVGSGFYFDPTPNGTGGSRSLWGRPVYATAAASAIAASAKSLIFFNPAFVGMREGPGLTVLRDPYSTDGIVFLKYRFRAVYKVLQAEAVVYATHPTA